MNKNKDRVEKKIALKRIRENYYDRRFTVYKQELIKMRREKLNENKLSESQRKEITRQSKGQSTKCVPGNT
jgi:hypothetical protein|tara:strand:+ start:985 stop:1197 length:213 start_codon:yes stop_codon:yes gene_type:complete